jgi:hypothetical protein
VEHLIKRHREIRGGRFVAAFEHPVRQVFEGKVVLLLTQDLDGPGFSRMLILGPFLNRKSFHFRGARFGGECLSNGITHAEVVG